MKKSGKTLKENLMILLIAIILAAILYALGGLVMYFVGKFVINVFEINYNWTYMHGLATTLVLSILKSMLTISVDD